MASLIFLSLALIATVVYFWRHRMPVDQKKSINRYDRKRSTAVAPEKLSEDIITEQLCKNDDENVREIRAEGKDPLMNELSEIDEISTKKQVPFEQSDYIVAVYLVAKEGEHYSGYELLQALLSAGLRYGQQKIFHRHTHKDGRGDILFHCASATAPGTFDLTKMGSFSGRGLCLFFTAGEVEEPLAAFDCLMETLDQLIDDLGGDVFDEKHALFTKDKMIQHRQQLRMIENNKTTTDMFSSAEA
ncbi:MAG: cell division protein ZipA C-terminal FtsZ-binding domain-containing protein [Coxiellaceae bacterium]|nr:cell division protein ZipA C-terminal FtsZ-binding domain-containing protein [Coxiellaceae bacterium]